MAAERSSRNLEQEHARRVLARQRAGADLQALACAVQARLGHVPETTWEPIAERAGTTAERVRALVETGAGGLRAEPSARYRVTICTGRTCARRGGAALLRAARRTLGIGAFESTGDGAIHLEPFRCFGQCAMAPNVRLDGRLRGAMTEARLGPLLAMLQGRAAADRGPGGRDPE